MQEQIHPLAIVEPGAKIGKGVVIEAFAVVKKDVVLHDDVTICSHAYISGHTTIGEGTKIWPSASIGNKTQDKKFKGEITYINIGKHCEIRELVMIESSSGEETSVEIGDYCLIKAHSHVAHNCVLGSEVVMENKATLAGHVLVGDCAVIGSMTGVHQFTRIGCYSKIENMSRVTRDVPPYSLGGGGPYIVKGIHQEKLLKKNFSEERCLHLADAYKWIYQSDLSLQEALEKIKSQIPSSPEIEHLLNFCVSSQRGLIGKEPDKSSLNKEVSVA